MKLAERNIVPELECHICDNEGLLLAKDGDSAASYFKGAIWRVCKKRTS